MRGKNQVGQILLTHPKDQNFTTLYEEAFSKQGETVELFAVIEIADADRVETKILQAECQKLAGALVAAYKKSFVESPLIDEDAFERSLAAVNGVLSRSLSRGKVNWFGKLNVCLAAIYRGELSLSVTGSAQALLLRGGELTSLSSDLAETKTKPIKIFSTYTSGKLGNRDRVVLTQNQLLNYLSAERIEGFLREDTLDECCQEIIAALNDIKNVGFATFICEIGTAKQASEIFVPETSAAMPVRPPNAVFSNILRISGSFASAIWFGLLSLFKYLGKLARWLMGGRQKNQPREIIKPRPRRKYIFTAIAVVIVLLLGNIAYGYVKKSLLSKVKTGDAELTKVEQLLDGADAAIIYKDQKKVVANVEEAGRLLSEAKGAKPSQKWTTLETRLNELKNKISKSAKVESPVTLATFPNVPTDLLRSPDGILAWNRDSGSFAMYDFRSGSTKSVLKTQNSGNLVAGAYTSGSQGYVFLTRDGQFAKLDLVADKIVSDPNAAADPNLASGLTQGNLVAFGSGSSTRLYLIDGAQNQIWRFRVNDTGIGLSEKWLKEGGAALGGAIDVAVDGNIYLLKDSGVDKYFNGAKVGFELAPLTPPLQKAAAIFATENTKSIYILDPANQRLLIFDKTGQLQSQLTSDKFRDAADLYVDETAKIIYILSGSDLLRINL